MINFIISIKEYMQINEHFVNAFKNNNGEKVMRQNGDRVWKILCDAYEYLKKPGMKTGLAGIDSLDELIDDCDAWKMWRGKDHVIRAVICYKFKYGGRKSVYLGSDGTPKEKAGLMSIMAEDGKLVDRQCWDEASEKAASVQLKIGYLPIKAIDAKQILARGGKKC